MQEISRENIETKEIPKTASELRELPKWFNNEESLGKIDSFKKADRPLNEIVREGGSYKDVRKANEGGEVHHFPADSTTEIPYKDGPSIHMETKDHRKTASWGLSKEAVTFRRKQQDLIKAGKFEQAMKMDIDDIQSKFGSKYDKGINQAMSYAKSKGYYNKEIEK